MINIRKFNLTAKIDPYTKLGRKIKIVSDLDY